MKVFSEMPNPQSLRSSTMKLVRIPVYAFFLMAMLATAAEMKSGVFEPARMAPDFSLAGSNGEQIKLSEQHGKVVVLGFGFSNCANICPMTLANLAQVYKNLGELADEVQVFYVTVDPARDSAERLHEYITYFNPNFIGLTGSAENLSAVRDSYGITATREEGKDGDYEVHHSTYLYLIDRQGLLRALVPFGQSAEDVASDIKVLLQEEVVAAAS